MCTMSGGISPEEFQRFQSQLIELREEKYIINEAKIKAERMLRQYENQIAQLEKDLQISNDVINRSKRNKEIDALVRENESLRDRLNGIESNFMLQIETLRIECQHLTSENERLTCQLETYKPNKKVNSSVVEADLANVTAELVDEEDLYKGNLDDENESKSTQRSLQLEITKLCEEKDELKHQIENYEAEIKTLKSEKKELTDRVYELLNEVSIKSRELQEKEVVSQNKVLHWQQKLNEVEELHTGLVNKLETEISLLKEQSESNMKQMHSDLISSHETQLSEIETRLNSRISTLENDIENQKLQHEREKSFLEEQAEIDIEAAKELIRGEMEDLRRSSHALIDQQKITIEKLEKEVAQLKEKLHFSTDEIKSQKRKFERQLKDLKRQLEKEAKRADDLAKQLTNEKRAAYSLGSRHSMEDLLNDLPGSGGGSVILPDDASSVYSTSNSAHDAPQNNLFESDFKGVIDRLTSTQEENCELKRQVSRLEEDLTCLQESITRKDAIISKYMHSRGSAAASVKMSDTKYTHDENSDPPNLKMSASLQQLMNNIIGGATQRKVAASSEVKQLQQLCEELLTKNMHLEKDLIRLAEENNSLKLANQNL